jgi:methylated-DNA-[protein]-cysteine S-methyltransferase
MQMSYQAIVAAPFGALGVRLHDKALAAIDFLTGAPSPSPTVNAAAEAVATQLARYLDNPHHQFDFPLSLVGTPFQRQVWQALRAIPVGETITYAELAQRVSSGPRAVANACGANPVPIVIPCHRVVAKGGLGGFMKGRETNSLSIKHWLLAHERGQSSIAG